MRTVLLRHYPELGNAQVGVSNAFQPCKESMARKSRVTKAVKAHASMSQLPEHRSGANSV